MNLNITIYVTCSLAPPFFKKETLYKKLQNILNLCNIEKLQLGHRIIII